MNHEYYENAQEIRQRILKQPIGNQETIRQLYNDYDRNLHLNGMAMENFARWRKRTKKFINDTFPAGRNIVIRAMIRTSRYPEEIEFLKTLKQEEQ